MWLLILVLAVAFYYVIQNQNGNNFSHNKALDQLKERYISGEIDEQTYLKMKRVIEK